MRLWKGLVVPVVLILLSLPVLAQGLRPYKARAGDAKATFTDEEINSAVYSDYKYPEGFYQDSLKEREWLRYITGADIHDPNSKRPAELCTDDPVDATSWDQLANAYASTQRFLTLMNETDRYYEFVRKDTGSTVLFRVHKCSYVDLSRWDVHNNSGMLGVFNKRGFTKSDVRDLAEYLRLIRDSSAHRYDKVLSSFTREFPDRFEHIMYATEVAPSHQKDVLPDNVEIALLKLIYRVEKRSGVISLQSRNIRKLKSRSNPSGAVKHLSGTNNRK